MSKLIHYPLSLFLLLGTLNFWLPNSHNAQLFRYHNEDDSLKIYILNEMVDELLLDKESSLDYVLAIADSAYKISEKINHKDGLLKSSLNVGKIYKLKRDFKTGLNYYLKAISTAEELRKPLLTTDAYVETAIFYQEWKVDEKAIYYYKKGLDLAKKSKQDEEHEAILKYLSIIYQYKLDYTSAEKYFNELISFYQKRNDEENEIATIDRLLNLFNQAGKYNDALVVSTQLLEQKKAENDTEGTINYLNRTGIIHKRLKNYDAALAYFQEAIGLYKKNGSGPSEYAYLMISQGVIYQIQQQFAKALTIFEDVLTIRTEEGNKKEITKTLNYLITLNMGLQDYDKSKIYCLDAIEIAEEINDVANLEKNYQRLSEIYEKTGSSKKALAAYKEYLTYKEEFYAIEKTRIQELTQKQLDAEKAEKDLKLQLADQEMKTLELSNLKVESEKKEQELEMLTQQKKLQEAKLQAEQFEKDRVAQALKIAQQKLEAEKKEKAISDLQRQQELKDLELKQKELEEQEKMSTIALLENEKKLQEQKIAEEAKLKEYGIWIIALCGFVMLVITVSFIMKQKANKKLKAQQSEILDKNSQLQVQEEELRQNMEELQATQEDLQRSKNELEGAYVELETKNTHLTDSIKYAKRIQNAILPPEVDLKAAFPEHFVIFIPKDMVSGDFYWFSQQGNRSIIATVDCTGHGVPGAFMSMIGNAHLNQIVNEQGIHDPAEILENMHHLVLDSLNQKDSRNVDGMDLAIACIEKWDDGMTSLKFSGAKCPLFHYRDGEVKRLDPDRKSIGGWYDGINTTFTDRVIQLKEGDIIYLTTDGFIDTANEDRRRFGSSRVKELIKNHGHKPAYEQKLIFENTLSQYQKDTDQRDDVTLIGIKV